VTTAKSLGHPRHGGEDADVRHAERREETLGPRQEDIFPVTQFEKLWVDLTALPEIDSRFVVVPRLRVNNSRIRPSSMAGCGTVPRRMSKPSVNGPSRGGIGPRQGNNTTR